MPFTRHPLSYPINQIFTRVGIAWTGWMDHLPRCKKLYRRRFIEHFLNYALGLTAAKEAGYVKHWRYRWCRYTGRIRRIRVIPQPRYRRTPGLSQIKKLFDL